jgi:hypothetical protein
MAEEQIQSRKIIVGGEGEGVHSGDDLFCCPLAEARSRAAACASVVRGIVLYTSQSS